MRFKPLVCLATLLLAFCLSHPSSAAAQSSRASSIAPGQRLTAQQSAKLDSLMRAARAEAKAIAAKGGSQADRQALEQRVRDAIRALLTPEQREAYDEKYARAAAKGEVSETTDPPSGG